MTDFCQQAYGALVCGLPHGHEDGCVLVDGRGRLRLALEWRMLEARTVAATLPSCPASDRAG